MNAHDKRTLEERLEWIADWSEPGIDLADAGTAREALEKIREQAARIAKLEAAEHRARIEGARAMQDAAAQVASLWPDRYEGAGIATSIKALDPEAVVKGEG